MGATEDIPMSFMFFFFFDTCYIDTNGGWPRERKMGFPWLEPGCGW